MAIIQYVGRAATTFNTVGVPDNAIYRPNYKVLSFSTGVTSAEWELALFVDNVLNEAGTVRFIRGQKAITVIH